MSNREVLKDEKIYVATDFSERSDRALRRATIIAKSSNMEITLIHVIDDDQPPRLLGAKCAAAEELLSEYVQTVLSVDNVKCSSELVISKPFSGLIKIAVEKKADLLVIGSHRRQIFRDLFIGTTA